MSGPMDRQEFSCSLVHLFRCLSRMCQVPFYKSLVWRNLGLNPGLIDYWRTLYPQVQVKVIHSVIFWRKCLLTTRCCIDYSYFQDKKGKTKSNKRETNIKSCTCVYKYIENLIQNKIIVDMKQSKVWVIFSCMSYCLNHKEGINIPLTYILISNFHLSSPVGWGCRIHGLNLCRRVRKAPTSVEDMTLNYKLVSLQSWWFGECGEPLYFHTSQVHTIPEWEDLIGS